MDGAQVRWLRDTSLKDAFLRSAQVGPKGFVGLHKTRIVEDAHGASDRDEIELRDGSGRTVASWGPGFGFADVLFGVHAVWINTFEKIVMFRSSGDVRELFPLEPRELGLVFASPEAQIVCRTGLGRPRLVNEPRGTGARCRSSTGWSFDGDWNSFSPLSCGGYLVAFEDKPGQERGQHRWHRAIVRDRNDGHVVATRDTSGGRVSCWQDSALIEAESGRLWSLPSLDQGRVARCADESATVWAAGAGCPWCVGASRLVRRVTEVEMRSSGP